MKMALANRYDKDEVKKPLKFLNNNTQFKEEYFPKRPALDVSFKNIRYSISTWHKMKYGE